jgi:small-conductance mechanosensitive channel
VFLVGAGVVLSTADIFRSVGLSLLASAGGLALILGFAAREVLGNILASLQIALNQSARVGDRLLWQDHLAYVERIHFTYVQLRNWDDTRIIVPVSEFVSESFVNWTITDPKMLKILRFKLRPEADMDALKRAFREVLEEMKAGPLGADMGDIDTAAVSVAGQDALGMDVFFSVPCEGPITSWNVECEARERLIAKANQMAERTGRPVFPETAAMDMAA